MPPDTSRSAAIHAAWCGCRRCAHPAPRSAQDRLRIRTAILLLIIVAAILAVANFL